MTFLPLSQPLLREKQQELDIQDLQGLLRFDWKVGKLSLWSGFYTRIDQVFILWGLICAGIFLTAQFLPVSWYTQAILWSVLTFVASMSMIVLTWFWVSVEKLRWLLYGWIILMVGGVTLTDLGIFCGWGTVLMHLCPLWLIISAAGYLLTAWAVRSRTFLLIAIIHLTSIAVLPLCCGWQFFATGVVMAASLLILAEWQWDMRQPIEDYAILTPEQKLFNQQQYELRLIDK
ncbi:MAG: hypothetical protein KME28_17470 [Pelatocladus maniniholoensis HA4357-MV3]|jgi:hypothetical protein|uniref:Uncharacterized protein n=1 Tax=Pelatocladus maniniholoensis HA4357-MV3 TaxID=1117104 RepID=A0A9E3LUW7_9NOST|nr:hypothetical protein [Pelatocladus maniniholoensis HA4357-MV3]BAZ65867.1 hypothetical protein NIES4106_06120 [Fischerella sp. NIES-4106]